MRRHPREHEAHGVKLDEDHTYPAITYTPGPQRCSSGSGALSVPHVASEALSALSALTKSSIASSTSCKCGIAAGSQELSCPHVDRRESRSGEARRGEARMLEDNGEEQRPRLTIRALLDDKHVALAHWRRFATRDERLGV